MIDLSFASGKRYAVLGLGKSGLASAAALKAAGALVTVWDDKEEARAQATAQGFAVADPMEQTFLHMAALIVAPGIPLTHPTPHPAIDKARRSGVPVIGDIALLLKAEPDATYIGITGTNGKSTTTALIAHILKNAGKKVAVGGNLGTPALTLEPMGKEGFYVLELSSFQLDLIQPNPPIAIAVLLNITPDHFDRHGDMQGYIAAKKRLFRLSGDQTVILGTDEPETAALFTELSSKSHLKLIELSVQHEVKNGYLVQDKKILATNQPTPVIDTATLPALPGLHNAQNVMAAFAACQAAGLDAKTIVAGIKSFPGLAHRQQLVGTMGGVRFINDSKATNADATSKALVCYDRIYWIVGGKPKVGGLSGLETLMPRVAHAFLIGQAAPAFADWCKGKVPFTHCKTLDVAVVKAAEMAWRDGGSGAVVLLSPACASFDQFTGFEARGEAFAAAVRVLPDPPARD
jgi:UDP-N-acetylmuramoylalanine--D-glutamate ligase